MAQNKNSKSELQRKRHETTRVLKESGKQLELNRSETAKKLNEVSRLTAEIELLDKEINHDKAIVDSLGTAITVIEDTINDLNIRITNLSDKYAAALRHRQSQDNRISSLSFIFASESFSQALRRYRSLKQFAKWRTKKADEINSMKQALELKRQEIELTKKKQQERINSLTAKKQELDKSKKTNDELVNSLRKKGKEIKSVIDKKQKELNQLDKQLEKLIAEEQARIEAEKKRQEQIRLAEEKRKAERAESIRIAEEKRLAEENRIKQEQELLAQQSDNKGKKNNKKNSKGSKETTSTKTQPSSSESSKTEQPKQTDNGNTNIGKITQRSAAQLTADFASSKGRLRPPVDGRLVIVKHFGRQKHPSLPMIETDNPGIDLLVNDGTQARAVFEGTVSAVFQQPGYNTIVMIRHGDYLTVYANLENITVRRDERVFAGQNLGTIANDDDDDSSRPVLHFEIRHEKDKENPEIWLRN